MLVAITAGTLVAHLCIATVLIRRLAELEKRGLILKRRAWKPRVVVFTIILAVFGFGLVFWRLGLVMTLVAGVVLNSGLTAFRFVLWLSYTRWVKLHAQQGT